MTRYLLLALLAFAGGAAASADVALELNAAERDWLADNRSVSICVDPDWLPFEILNARGEHEGIAADLLRLVASRAGLQLDIVATSDWDESVAYSQAGRCQLLSFLNQTPLRDAWLIFTQPLFTDANVVIAREDHPYVADLSALAGATVALPSGTSVEESVRRDFPQLRVISTDTDAQALALVNDRKADLTVRSLTVAAYTIRREGWFNLKIAGQLTSFDNQFRIGVLKSEPVLRDILNKAIATITPSELNQIANSHALVRLQSGTDYRLILQIVVAFSVMLLTSLFWIGRLRRLNEQLQVKSQTDALTGLANRAALDRRFAKALEQARRYHRPFSVVMLDIDHFKRINDEFGHQMGDRVLKQFAGLLQSCLRGSDAVGRWGGEEFLVLCPETSGQQAVLFAERLCEQARTFPFSTVRAQTLSAGVAELNATDTVDSLLRRADASLYRAKHEGRDRVCWKAPDERPI
ncbi:diguanylate cyclase [Pseudomonas stutzeri]|uniref:diguanylate cyclase n=1 Tax=Stutzerimonas stutzeri TaxID=316 RepID=UPI002109978E|nr:diguanylate cyclase [Stutzerimonas stutzeri]MCQ4296862.1 diguanylate cyclase [Stutzerimonas stutzeri]